MPVYGGADAGGSAAKDPWEEYGISKAQYEQLPSGVQSQIQAGTAEAAWVKSQFQTYGKGSVQAAYERRKAADYAKKREYYERKAAAAKSQAQAEEYQEKALAYLYAEAQLTGSVSVGLTAGEFEKRYGTTLGYAPGYRIETVRAGKGKSLLVETSPLPYFGELAETSVEAFYGVEIPDLPKGVAITDVLLEAGELKLKAAPLPYEGELSKSAIEEFYGVKFQNVAAGLKITGVDVSKGTLQILTKPAVLYKGPLTEEAVEAFYGVEIADLPPGVKISEVWLAGSAKGTEIKFRTELLPYAGPLTEKEIEAFYGVDITIPQSAEITGVRLTEEGAALDLKPKPYPGVLTEEEIERFYGVNIPDLPEGLKIIGVKTTEEGISVETAPLPYPGALTEEAIERFYGINLEIPSGSKITGVVLGTEGISVSLEGQAFATETLRVPAWQEVSMTGHIYRGTEQVPPYLQGLADIVGGISTWLERVVLYPGKTEEEIYRIKQVQSLTQMPATAIERRLGAGFLASWERYVAPAPSISSALIGSAGASILEKRLVATPELQAYAEAGPAYWVGNVTGEIIQSLILAEALGWVWGKLPGRITAPVEKAVSKVTEPVKAGLAKVPGIRKLLKAEAQQVSFMGEFETRLLTPDEILSRRITGLSVETKKISLEQGLFLKKLLEHTSFTEVEAGGKQVVRVALPETLAFFETQATMVRPAELYLAAAKAAKPVLTSTWIEGASPIMPYGFKTAAARKFTAITWWGTIEESFLQEFLGKATATIVGGGLTKAIAAESVVKIGVPAIVGAQILVSPAIQAFGIGVAAGAVAAAKPFETTVPIGAQVVSPTTETIFSSPGKTAYPFEKQYPVRADIPDIRLRQPSMPFEIPGIIEQEVQRPFETIDVDVSQRSALITPSMSSLIYGPPPTTPPPEPPRIFTPTFDTSLIGAGIIAPAEAQWYLKKHPIFTPSEFASHLLGSSEGKSQIRSVSSFIIGGRQK